MAGFTPMQVTLKGLLKILNQATDAGYVTVTEEASSPYALAGVAQLANGSWELTKTQVNALRPCKVSWYELAAANKPVTADDGALDGDIVNSAPVAAGNFPSTPTPEVTYVTLVAPTRVDGEGTATDHVVLTRITGVTWVVGGVSHTEASFAGAATKDVPTGGALSVVVQAQPATAAYAFNPGHTTSWTFTFTNVVPAVVLFEDDFGTTALTEAEFLARATPTGGVAVAKAGSGAVSVNASGQLVLDATAGNVALDWAENSSTGRMIMDVVSVSNLSGANSIQMQLRGGVSGFTARGTIYGAYYAAQVQASGSTDAGSGITRGALPKTFTTTVTESPVGTVTATIAESGGGATSTHTKTGFTATTDTQRSRLFVPAGTVLTIGRIRKESV